MQDIIQKIIEIDHMAQKMTEEALALKGEAETSIEGDKKALREQYIEKAHKRIAVNSQTEEKFLDQALSEIKSRYEAISEQLESVYEKNHSSWVNDLYSRVIGG